MSKRIALLAFYGRSLVLAALALSLGFLCSCKADPHSPSPSIVVQRDTIRIPAATTPGIEHVERISHNITGHDTVWLVRVDTITELQIQTELRDTCTESKLKTAMASAVSDIGGTVKQLTPAIEYDLIKAFAESQGRSLFEFGASTGFGSVAQHGNLHTWSDIFGFAQINIRRYSLRLQAGRLGPLWALMLDFIATLYTID